MTMPTFLVIGAGKAGTSSLHHYLSQHPQIYITPIKEPKFFAFEGEELDFGGPGDQTAHRSTVTDIETYRALFDGVSGERAAGEVSPVYIYIPKAPERIEHYIPEAKLIAVLRDPVERAYSSFQHLVREGREPFDDFARAIHEEESRIKRNYAPLWHYKEGGFYSAQLSRYLERFERRRIRIYLYEDLKEDPAGVLRDIFEFLDVDESFVPDMSARYNVGGVPKNKGLHAFLTRPNPIKAAVKPFVPTELRKRLRTSLRNRNLHSSPEISLEVRQQLIEVYREDILNLEELIQRDLSRWLEQARPRGS
jgi:Sulfotransferase family